MTLNNYYQADYLPLATAKPKAEVDVENGKPSTNGGVDDSSCREKT